MTKAGSSFIWTSECRKLASVIDLSIYEQSISLFNTVTDAQAMSLILKTMGFLIHVDELELNPTYIKVFRFLVDFECLI